MRGDVMSVKRKIAIAAAAVILAAAAFYTRPLALSQICGDIDILQSNCVHGYYTDSPRMTEDGRFEIEEDDERFLKIIELFKNKKFKRSLWNFLPNGTKMHRFEDGDFKWEVMFDFNEIMLPDGSKGSGSVIRVSNFFGEVLEIHFNGDTWRCDVSDKDTWLEEVMSLIKGPLLV